MKTIIYLTAILTFCIPGMLNGQVQPKKEVDAKSKNTLTPTTKVSYDVKKENKRNSKSPVVNSPSEKMPIVNTNVNERIDLIDRQIAELEKLKSGLKEVNSSSKGVYSTSVKSQLIVKIDEFFEVLDEANALDKKYASLRKKALLDKENGKTSSMKEANEVYRVYEIKQIEVSNILAQINYTKFNENKVTINTLLFDYKGGAIVIKLVNKLTDEADYAMRMAVEIREEANAQPNNSARLGNYSNAEEKEVIALNKQGEAITILEKTAFINFFNVANDLALNIKAFEFEK